MINREEIRRHINFLEVLAWIAANPLPHTFIAVQAKQVGERFPASLSQFIAEKHQKIEQGAKVRKYSFREKEWHLLVTFLPTNQPIPEAYSLKTWAVKQLRLEERRDSVR